MSRPKRKPRTGILVPLPVPIAAHPVTDYRMDPPRVWPVDIDEPEDWRLPAAFLGLGLSLVVALVALLVGSIR